MAESMLLSEVEIRLADYVAKKRNTDALRARAKPAFGATDEDDVEMHLNGFKGELGIAKLLDLYPNMLTYAEEQERGGSDLPYNIGVRAAKKRYALLIHDEDPPQRRFVAAFISGDEVVALGWDYAESVQRPEWWDDVRLRTGGYLKPEAKLRPLSSLRALIAEEKLAELGTGGPRHMPDNFSWLCSNCHAGVALRAGLCGKCWLQAWKESA